MEMQSDQLSTAKQEARTKARNHQNHGGLRSAMRSMNVSLGSLGTVAAWIVHWR